MLFQKCGLLSGISINQAYDQHNQKLKQDCVTVRVTESSSQLPRWINAGATISRVINLFQT